MKIFQFEERRREFHTTGINDLEEIYTFLLVQDMKEMEKLCIDGIKNGNSDSSILGNASMGGYEVSVRKTCV